jgi:hypothetical protein
MVVSSIGKKPFFDQQAIFHAGAAAQGIGFLGPKQGGKKKEQGEEKIFHVVFLLFMVRLNIPVLLRQNADYVSFARRKSKWRTIVCQGVFSGGVNVCLPVFLMGSKLKTQNPVLRFLYL